MGAPNNTREMRLGKEEEGWLFMLVEKESPYRGPVAVPFRAREVRLGNF
jgi:hypothetical protein